MKKYLYMMGLVFALSLSFTGCVTTGKYRMLETAHNDTKARAENLDAQVAQLQTEVGRLQGEKEALEKNTEATKGEYDTLVSQLQQEVQNGQLTVTRYKNMLKVDVAEKIFFDSGSAVLKESGKDVLQKVSSAIGPMQNKVIQIVGHTDNVAIAKSLRKVFLSNWELSAARAINVVHFLQDKGNIAPERLIAMGRAQYDPIAPNDTPEGRQQNRRIEITLIDKSISDMLEEKTTVAPEQPNPKEQLEQPVQPAQMQEQLKQPEQPIEPVEPAQPQEQNQQPQ